MQSLEDTDDSQCPGPFRKVKSTFLSRYKTLNLVQEQLQRVKVNLWCIDFRVLIFSFPFQLSKGSIIVSVTLEPTNTTTGANLTILLSQLEQDVSTINSGVCNTKTVN